MNLGGGSEIYPLWIHDHNHDESSLEMRVVRTQHSSQTLSEFESVYTSEIHSNNARNAERWERRQATQHMQLHEQ